MSAEVLFHCVPISYSNELILFRPGPRLTDHLPVPSHCFTCSRSSQHVLGVTWIYPTAWVSYKREANPRLPLCAWSNFI